MDEGIKAKKILKVLLKITNNTPVSFLKGFEGNNVNKLVTFLGHPSSGKTFLALEIAIAKLIEGKTVCYITGSDLDWTPALTARIMAYPSKMRFFKTEYTESGTLSLIQLIFKSLVRDEIVIILDDVEKISKDIYFAEKIMKLAEGRKSEVFMFLSASESENELELVLNKKDKQFLQVASFIYGLKVKENGSHEKKLYVDVIYTSDEVTNEKAIIPIQS